MAIPVIMVLIFFIGQLMATRILNPIRKLTKMAKRITTEDLGERIESEYYYREMNSLVDAFNEMISRLEKSFHHIEEFGAHVAHELKTPLTVIKGESELALMKVRSAPEYERALKINLEECERMLKIIEDLLLLARMDYQPGIFEFKIIDITAFMEEIFQQTAILSAKKKITLKLNNSPKKYLIRADPIHLRRLFLNLIDNAIKFTPEKGIIQLSVSTAAGHVNVAVKDSGMGIPQHEIQKVFERFYRINPQAQGSGLGLNIALTIARIHQGDIRIKSVPQKGSTFIVILPLNDLQ